MTPALTPAVAYYRMSSDDQEGSIDQQRNEVQAWASRNGYRIVGEYVDEGKSGSKDHHKRVQFLKMLADSGKAGWKHVLAYHTNRLGRLDGFDPDLAEAVQVWRTCGITIVTLNEGKIDLASFSGRLMFFVSAEMNHKYSVDLSGLSLRGRIAALEAGEWPNGSAPYGYDRCYLPEAGEPVIVKRSQAFSKPKNWRLSLVVNEAEAEVVRRIYKLLVDDDQSMRGIAKTLNTDSVPSPTAAGKGSGKAWNIIAVRSILTNPAYMGLGYLGGKGRNTKRGKFTQADNRTKAGVCPVIVQAETFQKAQVIIDRKKRTKRLPQKSQGALSGVLYCAHCGYRLTITHRKGRKAYVCNSPTYRPGATSCKAWSVPEDELIPMLSAEVVERVDRGILDSLSAKPERTKTVDLDLLRSKMEAVKAKSVHAALAYLDAPAHVRPILTQQLEGIQAEASALEAKYQTACEAVNPTALQDFSRWWKEVRPTLVKVSGVVWRQSENEEVWIRWEDGSEGLGLVVIEEGQRVIRTALVKGRGIVLLDEPIFPVQQECRVEPSAFRSLLNHLGIRVFVTFTEGDKRKATPGRGRGRRWLVEKVEIKGSEDDTSASVKHYMLTNVWFSGCVIKPGSVKVYE